MTDTLRSALIRHQVYQQRFASGVARKVIRILNMVDRDLALQIAARLGELSNITAARLGAVLNDVRGLNVAAYRSVEAEVAAALKEYAAYEIEFQTGMVSKWLPVGANFTAPSANLVISAVTTEPMRGKLLREWVDELSEAKYIRVRDALRIGVVEGQTIQQMVNRIRGTRAAGFQDGLLEIDRRSAQAFVRTAVNEIGTQARQATFEENDDIIAGVQWVATLDDRTCPSCAPLDGKVFDLDDGPRPPFHVGCRCTIIPVMKDEFKLPDMGATRTSKGDEGPERVPASQTYQTWLRSQSAEFQDDTLGPSRGALFRRGDLTVDRFVNRNGDQLTLPELRAREPEAFKRAGVDG